MEDKMLYPELLKSANKTIRETTEQFIKEMGSIVHLCDNFVNGLLLESNLAEISIQLTNHARRGNCFQFAQVTPSDE